MEHNPAGLGLITVVRGPVGCFGNPCCEHGTCTATDSSYNCVCATGWHGANCAVDCKVPGNCLTIFGARNSADNLPSGTDLNGLYTKTAHTVEGLNAYQMGGADGPVLHTVHTARDGCDGCWYVSCNDFFRSCFADDTRSLGACDGFKRHDECVYLEFGFRLSWDMGDRKYGYWMEGPSKTYSREERRDQVNTDLGVAAADCIDPGSCPAFTISGAKNSRDLHTKWRSGQGLDGLYVRTSHICYGRPTWQKGGGEGPMLYWGTPYYASRGPGYADGVGGWYVGASEALAHNCSRRWQYNRSRSFDESFLWENYLTTSYIDASQWVILGSEYVGSGCISMGSPDGCPGRWTTEGAGLNPDLTVAAVQAGSFLTSCNASRDYLEVVRMTRTQGRISTTTEFMDSAKSESCPSPDGAGCVGLWLEWDSDFRSRPWDGTFGWVENLGVTIVVG